LTLLATLGNAFSGLSASQRAIDVVSNNVANLSNANYARETTALSARTYGGLAGGVNIDAVERQIDLFLERQRLANTASSSSATVEADYMADIEAALSASGDDGRLDATLSDFRAAATAAIASPSDQVLRQNVVLSARRLATRLNQISIKLDAIRRQADERLRADSVTIQDFAQRLARLNAEIAARAGDPPGIRNLQDQRDAVVAAMAEIASLSRLDREGRDVAVFIGQGRALVDGRAAKVVAIDRTDGFGALTIDGADVTDDIQSGRISAHAGVRDRIVPAILASLDQLAGQVATIVNSVNNSGVSSTRRSEFSSTIAVTDFSAIDLAKHDIVLLNAEGRVVRNLTDEFALPQVTTLADLKEAFDSILQQGGKRIFNVSVDNGLLSISVNPEGPAKDLYFDILSPRDERSFKGLFHLDDVFVGIEGASRTVFSSAGGANSDGKGRLTLSSPGPAQPERMVGQEITLSGGQRRRVTGYDAVNRQFILDTTWTTVPDSTTRFRLDRPDARSISVRTDLIANPERLAHGSYAVADFGLPSPDFASGTVQAATASSLTVEPAHETALAAGVLITIISGPGAGQSRRVSEVADSAATLETAWSVTPTAQSRYAIGTFANLVGTSVGLSGDSRSLEELSRRLEADFDVLLPDRRYSTSLAGLARDIAAEHTTRVTQAAAQRDEAEAVGSELDQRRGAVSGVNLDEEMAQLISLQNAYTASARVLSTCDELYKTLIQM
jgi:flagellar hook-associated protein 1 FlgK